jgi:hypothetical protein
MNEQTKGKERKKERKEQRREKEESVGLHLQRDWMRWFKTETKSEWSKAELLLAVEEEEEDEEEEEEEEEEEGEVSLVASDMRESKASTTRVQSPNCKKTKKRTKKRTKHKRSSNRI